MPVRTWLPAVLLLAEGYATAASLHEATGHPVAVAFDAGNLAHVAKALRTLYPSALLVLCGDDDVQTHARTGNNPGRDKAMAAARFERWSHLNIHGSFPAPTPMRVIRTPTILHMQTLGFGLQVCA